ncbi:MAG: hypothetical protein K2Y20_04770 [Sphingomonas sp.]|nr:hypothetical protein [Sphingomonas sp.]
MSDSWRLTYRALDHGYAKKACQNAVAFPIDIQDFAYVFANLQERRHAADYDPHFKLTKSEVLADIELAADVIERFQQVTIGTKRPFAAHVLFKKRVT